MTSKEREWFSGQSRQYKLLEAARLICVAHEAGLGGSCLHSILEDSNYEDIDFDAERSALKASDLRFLQKMQSERLLDVLECLTDNERLAAEWLWLRALRWEGWNISVEPH